MLNRVFVPWTPPRTPDLSPRPKCLVPQSFCPSDPGGQTSYSRRPDSGGLDAPPLLSQDSVESGLPAPSSLRPGSLTRLPAPQKLAPFQNPPEKPVRSIALRLEALIMVTVRRPAVGR